MPICATRYPTQHWAEHPWTCRDCGITVYAASEGDALTAHDTHIATVHADS